MPKLHGHLAGLKPNQLKRLENLYRRKVPPTHMISTELARDLGRLSREIGRQLGLLITREGRIAFVIVGDSDRIVIPDTSATYRTAPGRLKGLRCVHTHLDNEPLTEDDITDLALLRLDLMAAVTLTEEGLPRELHYSHLLPAEAEAAVSRTLPPLPPGRWDTGCREMILALEREISRKTAALEAGSGRENAILVSVTSGSRFEALDGLFELEELAGSAGVNVLDRVLQVRKKPDPRFLMGRGKLNELAVAALQKGATMLVFDQELNPSQIRSIADRVELKVIDRTQLILDIFAQRARSREGKLQVELAQLKYLLPRLVTRNTALSRLTGGIGGRGPGETKLEINRRRVRDRIDRLEKTLSLVTRQRRQQKSLRDKKGMPVISIIGYTNAGKSTLLNRLTNSRVHAESRLFATLDPSSRRLRFPRETEVIITDTVGFIKDLPDDLKVAFRATLEELETADLLLHVIDIANPRFREQIESVESILAELNLGQIPTIRVLNKQDLVEPETAGRLCREWNGIAVSAKKRETLRPLVEAMESRVTETLDGRQES
jgi:GTP-binding protein HflX